MEKKMKLIKMIAAVAISGFGVSIGSIAQAACNGSTTLGGSNGCYEATHPQYVILGEVDMQSAEKTIAYNVATGTGLNAEGVSALVNNVADTSSDYTLLANTDNAISFLEGGTVKIRANDTFTLTLAVPVISNGSECTPAFKAANQTGVGVSANFSVTIFDGTDNVASYAVANGGFDVDASATAAVLNCPSEGVADATLVFTMEPIVTTEYTMSVTIGFEKDGSRDTEFNTVGTDGEPAADVYEMTLGLTAAVKIG
jgi:hypothetical protein